eukprot:3483458-Prymnesium_polylepis.1
MPVTPSQIRCRNHQPAPARQLDCGEATRAARSWLRRALDELAHRGPLAAIEDDRVCALSWLSPRRTKST